MNSNRAEAERQDGMLPKFTSVVAAERELYAKRDRSLRWLESYTRRNSLELTQSRGDLESLEDLYFQLFGQAPDG